MRGRNKSLERLRSKNTAKLSKRRWDEDTLEQGFLDDGAQPAADGGRETGCSKEIEKTSSLERAG
jgi:hypothetical protein